MSIKLSKGVEVNSRTLKNITAAMAEALGLVMGWAILAENYVVPVVAVLAAIAISSLLRRRVKDVTRDERSTLLYEKAAGAAIRVCVPVVALVGIIFFAFRDSLPSELASAGYVLGYVACFFLLVHLAFYSYYSRRY